MVQNIDFKANVFRRHKTNKYFVFAVISEREKRKAGLLARSCKSLSDAGDGGVF